jgi:fucose permease
VAQTVFSLAPSPWVVAAGLVLGGTAFGVVDSGLNAFAAGYFDAREISWMHASYGLGAVGGPLLVTLLIGCGLSWRWAYVILAVVLAAVAAAFTLTVRLWRSAPGRLGVAAHPSPTTPAHSPARTRRWFLLAVIVVGLVIVAVQTGIESGVGLWGYVFLSAGRGLPQRVAALTISAYWGAIFIGRILFGAVAQRLGPERVLPGAIAGELVGTAVMAVPGSGLAAVAGTLVVGLAAAPVFPLLTLTTGQRVGEYHATRAVTYQVAASAAGGGAPGRHGPADRSAERRRPGALPARPRRRPLRAHRRLLAPPRHTGRQGWPWD